MFFAVFSVYLLVKNIRLAPVSVLLTAFAIGIYQSLIQISLVIIIIWLFQQLERQKPYKSFLPHFVLMGVVIFVAYLLSNAINDAIIAWRGLTPAPRLDQAKQQSIVLILQNALSLLQNKPLPSLFYFALPFYTLLYLLFGLAAIVVWRRGALEFFLFILGAIALKLVMDLPYLIFGSGSPNRAFMHVGWVIAGLFALLQQPKCRVFAFLSRLIGVSIFLLSALYVNQFYDSVSRQTESDMRRSSQIVNQIRLMPEYQKEPMPFLIVGEKNFPVTGSHSFYEGLRSKYDIFRHFTDFKFRQLNAKEDEQIRNKLAARPGLADYPDKGSILFVDGTAVLILDKSQISEENAKHSE